MQHIEIHRKEKQDGFFTAKFDCWQIMLVNNKQYQVDLKKLLYN